MNNFGILASNIYHFEFDGDSSVTSVPAISGWIENNLGQLNALLYSDFSTDGSDLMLEAAAVFKELYLYNYYTKQSRNALRGIINSSSSGGDNILSIKDANSAVTFVNKNEVSKVFRGLASDSKINMDKLIAQYNIYKAEPRQVGGIEDTYSTSEDETI